MKQALIVAAALALFTPLSHYPSAHAQATAAAIAAPAYATGETWVYNEINGYNRLQRGTLTREVTRDMTTGGVDASIVTRNTDGAQIDDARVAGGLLRSGLLNERSPGTLTPALEMRPFPLEAGKRWSQTVTRDDPQWREQRRVRVDGRVIGWETVRVPAGEFKAIKIERVMYLGDHDPFRNETHRHEVEWYVPELKMPVRIEVRERFRESRFAVIGPMREGDWFTQELTSYKRAD